ncbi:RagB/SusD family nutrient uptake outer membrane protein [Longimicrobium sp.]|jgi:hypothetical protein|uniref:RagB/SusD family nutrient uptake outer membrane protein n=1 Tax=Longimicrobium sp. TaxID=2029185 RepID=UPI002ED79924
MRIPSNRQRYVASALALVLATGACSDINVPDYNRAGFSDLQTNPNRTLVDAAAAGMLASARIDPATRVRLTGIVGREAHYLDPNESRYVTELVTGQIDPSSFAGNHNFLNPYGTIAQGNVLLTAIDKVAATEYTDAQKEGLRGFVKTVMGSEYLVIAMMHQYGVVDVSADPLAEPAPLKPQAEVYAKARQLLDEGAVHLAKGGTTFTFKLPSGLTGSGLNLSNPSTTFRQFNRGLRSRLDILTKDYAAALTSLGESFISTSSGSRAEFNRGGYYTFSAASGDRANALATGSPEVAEPTLRTDAQLKANGTRDERFLLKVDTTGTTINRYNIISSLRFKHYRAAPFFGSGGAASPIPWVRNEELILSRAEARWFTGDKPGALADLNFVRTNSGGLAAIAMPTTDDAFITALLYERRYSLMYEGGYRWLDLRRFGRLGTLTNYPRSGDKSIEFFPIPFVECLARGGAGSAPGC